ncbi:uncharacterized protein [Typha angustifolia]|uniref:uncharacterized protein isoform X1 n=1 Tax=Typha angustifolia TaxID=59011 RepID=UPI003C2D4D04
MVPAQTLDSVDKERKPNIIVKSETEEACRDPFEARDAALMCKNNCEDSVFHAQGGVMDKEVDILDCTGDVAVELVKAEDPDATEHSSSFGDTCSGSDVELKPDHSDIEVDSPFGATNEDAPVSNGLTRMFKKKKVTAHWRKFISPLMWRCQWLELRMKELQSQASKYDRQLGLLKHEKELQSKIIELDGSVSRSVPLSCQSRRKNAMKRRKRKRYEDIVDPSSYMSNHNIFSYYENKRTETDGHSVDDYCDLVDEGMKGHDDTDWLLGPKGGENSLEQILLNIEAVQSRVLKLRDDLSKAICKKAGETSFVGNMMTNYAQSASYSPGKNGDAMPVGTPRSPPHNLSDYEMEDVVMPESAVSSYGDAADLDIIESTMGVLFPADNPLSSHQIGDLCKENADDILIDNQVAGDEYQNFEVSRPREQPKELVKQEADSPSEEESTAPTVALQEPSPESEKTAVAQRKVLKPCYSGKRRGRKPKRRRRGSSVAAVSNWRSERIRKRMQSERAS